MVVRFPRPLKGWRVFVGEVGTIVLGVLLALAAQEFAQSLHWKREVAETRKALDTELARDVAAFDYRISQSSCVDARLSELDRWADSLATGSSLKLKAPIPNIPGFAIRTAAWQLTDGEIAARIPLAARLNYAGLYDSLTTFEKLRDQEIAAWETLAEYEEGSDLRAADLRAIKRALFNAEGINSVLRGFAPNIARFARDLGVRPERGIEGRSHRLIADWNRDLCKPRL